MHLAVQGPQHLLAGVHEGRADCTHPILHSLQAWVQSSGHKSPAVAVDVCHLGVIVLSKGAQEFETLQITRPLQKLALAKDRVRRIRKEACVQPNNSQC